ncbi:MAG: glucose-1-phosphate adenylyltransferase [Actinomycetota bacterium]|nr:glucose-1-phosphate adenylyltransferase [Actinomycetota bacterium]
MKRPQVLALVLAGGEGGRLAPLTDERAKPVTPFAGSYRLIDFPLSNCVHSGVNDVWVIQQYEPHELTKQLANGRPWDLDRTRGGLRILHPYLGDSESGWYEGNADAIYRNRKVIADEDPDVLLVLSADHVYKLDYADVVADLLESGAAVTMVTTTVPKEDASRYGVVEVDGDGKVREFEYKPDDPKSGVVTTEVFAYDARRLLQTLDELADEGDSSGLSDFGHELLPRLVDEGSARGFELDGYWRDVGTIESYWDAHMDLLEAEPRLTLDDPAWPILTTGLQRSPARVEASATLDGVLVAAGAQVRGTVVRSVLAPGVVVERGAEVRDAILLHDSYVGAGARVTRAILDEQAHVEGDAVVEGTDEVAVVATGARVSASA